MNPETETTLTAATALTGAATSPSALRTPTTATAAARMLATRPHQRSSRAAHAGRVIRGRVPSLAGPHIGLGSDLAHPTPGGSSVGSVRRPGDRAGAVTPPARAAGARRLGSGRRR